MIATLAASLTRPVAWGAVPPAHAIPAANHAWPNARAVAVSPDGAFVAGASVDTSRDGGWTDAGRIAIWKTGGGQPIRVIETRGDVLRLGFSADGTCLVYGIARTLGDAVDDDATFFLPLDGMAEPVRHPGSGIFAVASRGRDCLLSDPTALCLRVWLPRGDAADHVTTVPGATAAAALAYSSDGSRFAVFFRTSEPIAITEAGVMTTLRRLRGLAICNSASMQPLTRVETDAVADCSSLDVSAGGTHVATGHRDGTVQLWNGTVLEPIGRVDGTGEAPSLVRFSPDGGELAVLSQPLSAEAGTLRRCQLSFHGVPGLDLLRRFDVDDGGLSVSHPRREPAVLNPHRLAYVPGGDAVVIGTSGLTLLRVATGEVLERYDSRGQEPASE